MTLYRVSSAYTVDTIRADSTSEALAIFEARHGVRATVCRDLG